MCEKRILVIDDDKTIRMFMQKYLTGLGYSVKTVESAQAAFRILAKEAFPIIIADLKMPQMDGTQLCRQIRAENDRAVIYAFSGYLSDFHSEELDKAGFDGYLSKDSGKEVLQRAIEGAFERIKSREDNATMT